MKKNWTDLLHLLRFIAARFARERCAQIAASLTFTTLLSLVPLITIALTLFSAFPVFDEFSSNIRKFLLANMLPETGGKMISRYVEQFAESASRLTAMGIAFLALTAMLMMYTIEDAFNVIWQVSRPRALMQRILIYWAVLTLAPLLVGGSLTLTSWLVGLSAGYAKAIPAFEVALLKVAPVILTTLAFSLLFRIVPNRYVPMRHAVIGGAVAAVAFEAMNRAFGYYIAHFGTYKLVYGAFASFPVFLMWIYLSWLTVLFGALLTASLPYWRGAPARTLTPAIRLYHAVRLLGLLHEGMQSGKVPTQRALSARMRLGFDALESILERLAKANMVRKLAGGGWAAIRSPEHIRLAELCRLFVFDPAALPAKMDDPHIRAWFDQLEQRIGGDAATLQDLIAQDGAKAAI